MNTPYLKPTKSARGVRLLDITSPAFKADPYPFYARLRAEQPVARARMGKLETWLITRYDDVQLALKDERLVKNPHSVQSAAQQRLIAERLGASAP